MTQPPRLRLVHDDDDDRDRHDETPQDEPVRRADGDAAFDERETLEFENGSADAEVEGARARARRARAWRQAVAGGIAFQALAVLHDLSRDVGYVAAGAVAPPAGLAFPASLALWGAAVWLVLERARGGTRVLFLVAAAGMALAVPFWGLASPVTWPFELGGTLALAGAWQVRREQGAGVHLVRDAPHASATSAADSATDGVTNGAANDGRLP